MLECTHWRDRYALSKYLRRKCSQKNYSLKFPKEVSFLFIATLLIAITLSSNLVKAQVLQSGDALVACAPDSTQGNVTLALERISSLCSLYNDPTQYGIDQSSNVTTPTMWDINDFGGNAVFATSIDHNTGAFYTGTTVLYGNFLSLPSVSPDIYKIGPTSVTPVLLTTLSYGSQGIGYLEYDEVHDQIFAVNMDDGAIYRIDATSGAELNFFDPFQPDSGRVNNGPGGDFPALGERIIGVTYNSLENKVYYSTWTNDFVRNGSINTIHSISLDANGDFMPATDQLEISLPFAQLAFFDDFSMPVFDIEFNQAHDKILLAESGFNSGGAYPTSAPNKSRVLEYSGSTGNWTIAPTPGGNLQSKYDIGNYLDRANARGGVDWAYECVSGTTLTNDEGWMIATADALVSTACTVTDPCIYGFQITNTATGGTWDSSLLVDIDGIIADPAQQNKGVYGDVDVYKRVMASDLSLGKTVDQSSTAIGDVVTFTITIYNDSQTEVTGVEVTDWLPTGLSYVSSTPATGTTVDDSNAPTLVWNIGTISATTDSLELTVMAKVDVEGVLLNKSEITAMDGVDIDSTPNNGEGAEDDWATACISTPVELCDGQIVIATAASGFATYQWYLDGNPITGETNREITITQEGTYNYTVEEAVLGDCGSQLCCPIVVEQVECCPTTKCLKIQITKTF